MCAEIVCNMETERFMDFQFEILLRSLAFYSCSLAKTSVLRHKIVCINNELEFKKSISNAPKDDNVSFSRVQNK